MKIFQAMAICNFVFFSAPPKFKISLQIPAEISFTKNASKALFSRGQAHLLEIKNKNKIHCYLLNRLKIFDSVSKITSLNSSSE